jgi:acetolactate synthase-1/3 small subunit
MTGDGEKIKALIALVRPLGIREIVRTGKIAMARSAQLENANHRPPREIS